MISAPVLLADLHMSTAAGKYDPTDNRMESNSGMGGVGGNNTGGAQTDRFFDMMGDPFDADMVRGQLRKQGQGRGQGQGSEGGAGTDSTRTGLHLLVTAFEGHIYIIDGSAPAAKRKRTSTEKEGKDLQKGEDPSPHVKCAQRIDIGEHLYSLPLLDDLTGDGYLDMVVGTLNGQLLSFESSVPFHPINAWDSFPKNRLNGFSQGDAGISIPQWEREKLKALQTKINRTLTIVIDLWDANYKETTSEETQAQAQYTVTVTRGSSLSEPLHTEKFDRPGRYTLSMEVQPPMNELLLLRMENAHFQHYDDSVHVSISSRFYIWIKYMVVAPVAIFCVPLMLRYSKYL